MKCLVQIVCALSVLCVVSARSLPSPARNGMVYYQAAPGYHNRLPQRAMYVQQYRNLPYRANRRSADAGGVAAFAAGNQIAAGTYLRDCKTDEHNFEPQQPAVIRYDDEIVQSIAEAYPEQFPLDQGERLVPTVLLDDDEIHGVLPHAEPIPFIPENEVKVFEPETELKVEQPEYFSVDDVKPTQVDFEAPARGSFATAAPTPDSKKRVRIEVEDDDDASLVPFHRQGGNNGNIPANSFFPIQFGSTNGGAIAIANSFSTGKGGTATSHATAYGSPSKTKASKKRTVEA